jgi:outer membrane protein assembly factor BamB
MARDLKVLLYVGVKRSVVALDDRTGIEVWRVDLHSGDYVTVLWNGDALFAANAGEVWRLDPATGGVLWHNELKGMGRGLASLVSSRQPSDSAAADLAMAKRRLDAQSAASASA